MFFLLFFEISGLRIDWSLKINNPGCSKIGENIIIISLRCIRCQEKPRRRLSEKWPVFTQPGERHPTDQWWEGFLLWRPQRDLFWKCLFFLCNLQHLLQIQQKGRGVIICEVHLNLFRSEHITCIKDGVAPSFGQTYSTQLWSIVQTPQEQRPLQHFYRFIL